jgi:probable rRNA maturation factor
MIIVEPPHGPIQGRPSFSKRDLERFLALAKESVSVRGAVTVLITGDEAIRDLNRRFRHQNKATDVLSFPAEDFSRPRESPLRVRGARISGDLAISCETALRQAQFFGHDLSVELKILMLHGLLHLAGLDHETDSGEMAARERDLRIELGLPAGLIQRTQPDRPLRSARTEKLNALAARSSPALRKASVKTGKMPRPVPETRAGTL